MTPDPKRPELSWRCDGARIYYTHAKSNYFAFNLPLPDNLQNLLNQARDAHAALYPRSRFVCAADSAKGFFEAPREKTIPYVSPHMLRRTLATACVEAGLDPYTTKQLLNHRTITGDVTALYVQPSKGHLLESMGVVARYIEAKTIA